MRLYTPNISYFNYVHIITSRTDYFIINFPQFKNIKNSFVKCNCNKTSNLITNSITFWSNCNYLLNNTGNTDKSFVPGAWLELFFNFRFAEDHSTYTNTPFITWLAKVIMRVKYFTSSKCVKNEVSIVQSNIKYFCFKQYFSAVKSV